MLSGKGLGTRGRNEIRRGRNHSHLPIVSARLSPPSLAESQSLFADLLSSPTTLFWYAQFLFDTPIRSRRYSSSGYCTLRSRLCYTEGTVVRGAIRISVWDSREDSLRSIHLQNTIFRSQRYARMQRLVTGIYYFHRRSWG